MADQLPAVLTCAVTIGLLGLAEFLRLWDGINAQFWKGFTWATRCGFAVLLSFLIASLVGIGVYSRMYSTQEPLILLLGIYWVYGRFIQALFLWRIRKSICQVLAIACAGALQFAGSVISFFHWSNKDTAKSVASSGVIVFVLAFYCVGTGLALYRYKAFVWHIVVISILWLCVPASTIGFCWIPDELLFYLAHCFFLCIELLAILVSQAWVTWRLAREANNSSIFGDWRHRITTSDYGRRVQSTRVNSYPIAPATGFTETPSVLLEQDTGVFDWKKITVVCTVYIVTQHNMPDTPPPTPT